MVDYWLHGMSEYIPDRMSEHMPDRNRMSEHMPDRNRMSESIPGRMSEYIPDRMSEHMPDRNRMSESIPGRMSEYIPDRMSEHMPDTYARKNAIYCIFTGFCEHTGSKAPQDWFPFFLQNSLLFLSPLKMKPSKKHGPKIPGKR